MSNELWEFENPKRGSRANPTQSPDEVLSAVVRAFDAAYSTGNLRVGEESAEDNDRDHRTVIQFHVGADLFDLFFNGLAGYRAQFRRSIEIGLAFNELLIAELKAAIVREWPDKVSGRLLDHLFNDRGPLKIKKAFLLRSLDVHLSKIWMCTRRMGVDGTVDLPIGLTGHQLLLPNEARWSALSREEEDAWLEIKGAFVGEQLYQLKDPFLRASKLHFTGQA